MQPVEVGTGVVTGRSKIGATSLADTKQKLTQEQIIQGKEMARTFKNELQRMV